MRLIVNVIYLSKYYYIKKKTFCIWNYKVYLKFINRVNQSSKVDGSFVVGDSVKIVALDLSQNVFTNFLLQLFKISTTFIVWDFRDKFYIRSLNYFKVFYKIQCNNPHYCEYYRPLLHYILFNGAFHWICENAG